MQLFADSLVPLPEVPRLDSDSVALLNAPETAADNGRLKVGILGTGNIGCDMLIKLLKENFVSVVVFCGRRQESPGIKMAESKAVKCSAEGIDFFIDNPKCCDLVYDCTNATDAKRHAEVFKAQMVTYSK